MLKKSMMAILVGGLACAGYFYFLHDASQPNQQPTKNSTETLGANSLTLLNAGEGEKKILRLKLTVGAVTQVEVIQSAKTTLKLPLLNSEESTQTAGTTTKQSYLYTIEVIKIASDGSAFIVARCPAPVVLDPGTDDAELIAIMQQSLDQIKSINISYWLNSRGFPRDVQMKVRGNLPEELKHLLSGVEQSVAQLHTRLPEEPIGIGAKWQVQLSKKSGPIIMRQQSTFELTAVNDLEFNTLLQSALSSPAQALSAPGQKKGATCMSSISGTSIGSRKNSLLTGATHSGVMSSTMRSKIESQPVNVELDMQSNTKIEISYRGSTKKP